MGASCCCCFREKASQDEVAAARTMQLLSESESPAGAGASLAPAAAVAPGPSSTTGRAPVQEEMAPATASPTPTPASAQVVELENQTQGLSLGEPPQEEVQGSLGTGSHQGRRDYMEDRVVVQEEVFAGCRLIAVLDGHAGQRAVELVASRLVPTVQSLAPWPWLDCELLDAKFRELFADLDRQLFDKLAGHEEEAKNSCGHSSGLVALITFQRGGIFYLGSVGDCKAIAFSETQGAQRLSGVEHHPDEEGEKARLAACGATLNADGSLAGLAVSRALGDFMVEEGWSKPVGLISTPAVFVHQLQDVELVVVATDGLELSNQRTQQVLRLQLQDANKSIEAAAQTLAETAAKEGACGDNVGLALLVLKRPPPVVVEERRAPRLFGKGRGRGLGGGGGRSLDELLQQVDAKGIPQNAAPTEQEELH